MDVGSTLVPDADLAQAARTGDRSALAVLLDRHRASLYATALGILRDRDRAMDAVQETFLVALTRLEGVRDPAAVGPWLHAVVRNNALMELRRRRREVANGSGIDDGVVTNADRWLDQRTVRDWVWTALEAIPDDERLALLLRHFSRCHSYEAIAAVCDVPVGTVRSRLNRARRRLTDALAAGADAAQRDQTELETSRAHEWVAFYERLHETPEPATYRSLYHADVGVRDGSGSWNGVDAWSAEEREAIDVGVRAEIVGVAASRTVTVVEVDFINPPCAPGHCPPSTTFVHQLRDGRSARVDIYYHAG
jgi:RNA polymerase sigma-70 factor (ECF subfamily)